METLKRDFFTAWEEEIAAYQEVALILAEQKTALTRWDIRQFQKVSQSAALLIARSHKTTAARQDLMESLLLLMGADAGQYSLKNIDRLFPDPEDQEKASVFFKVFANTLKAIDRHSAENKELIRTGLELVGDNLEMIADIIDRDRVYSRVGMIQQKRTSILLNRQV
jgi:hypothetical protein